MTDPYNIDRNTRYNIVFSQYCSAKIKRKETSFNLERAYVSKPTIKTVFLCLPRKLYVCTSASGGFLQKWVVVLGVEGFYGGMRGVKLEEGVRLVSSNQAV